MAKVTFNKPGAPESLVAGVTIETTTTVAPATDVAGVAATPTATVTFPAPAVVTPVAPPAKSAPCYDDESIDAGDLVLPRLNIVQKVGEMSNVHPPGSIVLGGQLVLAVAPRGTLVGPAIRLLVVGFQPTIFAEKVEGGLRGNMVKSEQEVAARGGTLDWNEATVTKKPLYQRLSTALVLVEQPEGLDPLSFPIQLDGKKHALALYSMKGTSYTNAAKHFKSAKHIGFLKAHGYRGGWWSFSSQLKSFGANFAFIPVPKPVGASTPELRAQLSDLLGF